MPELITANDLACKSSGEVKTWIEKVASEKIKPPSKFNWLGLASATGSNAQECTRKNENSSSLEWAEISLRIYEKLSESSDKNVAHSCEMSAMTIRAFMINNFENVTGIYVLDGQIIVDWFYVRLDLSLEDALEESDQWHNLSHAEKISRFRTDPTKFQMIRRIKNRLRIFELLQKSGKINLDNNLKKWITARKQFL